MGNDNTFINCSISNWELYHKINGTAEKTRKEINRLIRLGKLRFPDTKTYRAEESVVFRRARRPPYGGLSNKALEFPLKVNDIDFFSSEALLQVCKYPGHPDFQKKIIEREIPLNETGSGGLYDYWYLREDWELVRKEIMYWCLMLKLAQHFESFGQLLKSTGEKQIVYNDPEWDCFWGARKDSRDDNIFKGDNNLGILLMRLREELAEKQTEMSSVDPLGIPDFLILEKPVRRIVVHSQ